MMNTRSFDFMATTTASPEITHLNQGTSLRLFLASLTFSASVLVVETLLFFLLKDKIAQL